MKKTFRVFAALALASVTWVQAQDSSIPEGGEQGVGQEDVIILEPSGTEPAVPEVPPTTDPTAAVDTGQQQQPETTVTVSQTFTNQTDAITIIGNVDRPEDKQAVDQALQQALPGKQVNNQLKVASQEQGQVTEPAGAERPEDQPQQSEQEQKELDQSGQDSEREFELESSDTQP